MDRTQAAAIEHFDRQRLKATAHLLDWVAGKVENPTLLPEKFDPRTQETKLSPEKEARFMPWLERQYKKGLVPEGDFNFYKQKGYGYDFDYRAAFEAGARPSKVEDSWHWPDLGKKINHPTFSIESKYGPENWPYAGTWKDNGEYLPGSVPFSQAYPGGILEDDAVQKGDN